MLCRGHQPRGRILRSVEFPHLKRTAEKASCKTSSANGRLWIKNAVVAARRPLRAETDRSPGSIPCLASGPAVLPPHPRPQRSGSLWKAPQRSRSRARSACRPPTMSLVSAKGPSVTVFCLPFSNAGMFEGLARVFNMAFFLAPSSGHPFSASSAAFYQGIPRARRRDKDIQIGSWLIPPWFVFLSLERLRRSATDIFLLRSASSITAASQCLQ